MNARILVVDEDLHLRETLKKILSSAGYEVCTARTGREALELVCGKFFEIILLDFNLTDKTGIEVVQSIRKLNAESQIIMLASNTNVQVAVSAIQEAVYDFLIKPVDFDYLKRVVKRAVEKLKLEQSIKNLIGELKVKNSELINLNEMKSKFLSMASHDLSNTLMAVNLSFDILAEKLHLDAEQTKKIGFIKNGLEQISRLINDLVDWASIEKGRFKLDKSCFEIGGFIDEVIDGSRVRAGIKSITVSVSSKVPDLKVCADKKRIVQVILNLFENAIRHTPQGGSIEIYIQTYDEKHLSVTVKDSGVGIEPKDAERLFESFYQVEGENILRGRLGLGLSIAKEIVSVHGCKIWVKSEGRGKGASFTFTLPLAQGVGSG